MFNPYTIPPAGLSAAAFFAPAAFADPARPPAILVDDIDPNTGELRGLLSSGDPVDEAIAFEFRTAEDSGSAIIGHGHRFGEIRKNIDGARAIELECRRILAPYVRAGLIEVVRVVGVAEGNVAGAFAEYKHVRTGVIVPVSLPQ